ncbi:ubiquinone biosynthesis protein coq9 mitochondrial [Phtheirospermum japonicum]|uniref:Ubiquinone biosynthesis protein n=1 Tax=Phtheirospermum japonicum TaxID=374723 RepID=A0A830AXM1_9LAMI|nr:ubiquinone biosynthesis protein coq9 mitochondrial [Phtheirospermum japonicum]
MYRSAARRLPTLLRRGGHSPSDPFPGEVICTASFSTGATSESPPNPNLNHFNSSTSSSTARTEHEKAREGQSKNHRAKACPKAHWQEEQARVLHASLRHVIRLGWSDGAMIAGAREVGVSPSIVGSFPRKEASLVEFFMDDCLQRLIDVIDTKEDLKNLIPSQRVAKLVKTRLEMQAPYISKWPQALSIQVQPLNIPTSLRQRAMLVDEIWHAADDVATDIDWCVKRTVLGGIYSVTELYMLTDTSPDFQNTWTFLDGRIKDAFDFKKSVQEAKYLAEAVEAGMGGSLQGYVKRIFRG